MVRFHTVCNSWDIPCIKCTWDGVFMFHSLPSILSKCCATARIVLIRFMMPVSELALSSLEQQVGTYHEAATVTVTVVWFMER